jgi:hypothetical protein
MVMPLFIPQDIEEFIPPKEYPYRLAGSRRCVRSRTADTVGWDAVISLYISTKAAFFIP